MSAQEVDGQAIVASARRWVGTPYRHQGRGPRGPNGGVDCAGLLIRVAVELGIAEPGYDPSGYAWETDGSQLRAELSRWAALLASADYPQGIEHWRDIVQSGDIVVFMVVGLPQHAAIVSAIDYGVSGMAPAIIHASNPVGRVVEHRLDERWARRIWQVWRLRGPG